MSVDLNANVIQAEGEAVHVEGRQPEQVLQEGDVVWRLSSDRMVVTYNHILMFFAFLGISLLFTFRWYSFIDAFENVYNILKTAGSPVNAHDKDLQAFNKVFDTAYSFSLYYFAFELSSIIIVFTYVALLYQYISDKIYHTPVMFLDDRCIIYSSLVVCLLQLLFFEVHRFAYDYFVQLAVQTRLSMAYRGLLANMGQEVLDNVLDRPDLLSIVEYFEARALELDQTLGSIAFPDFLDGTSEADCELGIQQM